MYLKFEAFCNINNIQGRYPTVITHIFALRGMKNRASSCKLGRGRGGGDCVIGIMISLNCISMLFHNSRLVTNKGSGGITNKLIKEWSLRGLIYIHYVYIYSYI